MSWTQDFLHQRRKLTKCSWLLELIFILAAITGMSHGHTILEEYSCGQGDIEYKSTLKGGTKAGLFHRQGEVKNIHECIHKCCQSKQCDVALMEGKQCFGVQCLNDTLCESVPASPGAADSFQISHVSTKGLDFAGQKKAARPTSLHDDDLNAREDRCPFNGVMYNVKLKGGLKAGRFTDVGRVKSVNTCIRYCCDSKVPCDLSFMLDDRCYLVKCYSEERCEAVPANAQDFQFKQRMAFVSPWLFKKNKKIMKVPSGLNLHHLKCVQTKVHTNTDLVGGPYAGDFKDMGKVGKPHRCTRMCCEDQECDVAYMVGENCFLVKCYSDDLCKLKKHNATLTDNSKKSSRSVQFIVSRDFDVTMDDEGKVRERHPDHRKCSMDGDIHNDTELLLGMLSGKLTPHTKVKEMKDCLGKCCDDKSCHVAVMNAGMCYSVHCDQPQLCQTKPASEAAKRRNPKVAYVMRGEDSIYVAPPPPPPPPPKENVTLASNETTSLNQTSPLNETETFNSTTLMNYYIQHYNMSHNATTAWFDKTVNNSMAGLYFFNNSWLYDPFWNITNLNISELEMSGSGSGMMSGSGSGSGESGENEMEEEEDDDEPPIEIKDEEDEQQEQSDAKVKLDTASGSGAKESSTTDPEGEAGMHMSGEGSTDVGSGTSSVSGESETGSAMEHISDIQPFSVPSEHDASASGMKGDDSGSGMKDDASGTFMQKDQVSSNEASGSGDNDIGSGSKTTVSKKQSKSSGEASGEASIKKEEKSKNLIQSDNKDTENESMDLAGLLTPVDEEPAETIKKDETNKNTDSDSGKLAKQVKEESKLKTMLENEAKNEDTSGEGSGKHSDTGEQKGKQKGRGAMKDNNNASSGDDKQGKADISSGEAEKGQVYTSSGELSKTSKGASAETVKADDITIVKGESTDGSGALVQSGSGQ